MLSPELREKAEELVGRYPRSRSALLPLLHLVQYQDGFITDDGIGECAELLGLTKAEVAAVATFFTMYKREPLGRHLVSVCTNFSCKVRGAQQVYDHLSDKLGVGHNGTTADGKFTLEHAECLGNCEGAPVVTVDYLNYEGMTPETAEELVDRLAAGERPPPTRGFPPTGVRFAQHRLAGLGPAEDDPVQVGRAVTQARAADGAVPLPEAGPGTAPVTAEPTFAPGQQERRAEARAAVRDTGTEPEHVEDAAGGRAREFPTTESDWEPRRPGEARAPGGAGSGGPGPEGAREADPDQQPRGEDEEPGAHEGGRTEGGSGEREEEDDG